MKKYLVRLADHLDKKGFYKEADYLDAILKKALDPSLDPVFPKEPQRKASKLPSHIKITMDRAIGWGSDRETEMLDYESRLVDIIKEMWSNLKIDIATESITEENRQRKELGRLEHGYHRNFEEFNEDEVQSGKDISMDRMTHDPGESYFSKRLYMDTPSDSYGKIVIEIKRPKGVFEPKTTITVGYYGAQLGEVKDFYFYQPGTEMDIEKREIAGVTNSEFEDFYNYIKGLGNSKYFKSEFKYS